MTCSSRTFEDAAGVGPGDLLVAESLREKRFDLEEVVIGHTSMATVRTGSKIMR
jgi:hypothetical protein